MPRISAREFVGLFGDFASTVGAGEESDPIGDGLRADAVAYWKLDESGGSRVDSSSNGHTLSEIGTVNGDTGKVGNAALLSRSENNGLKCINDDAFQSLGKATIVVALWCKITDITPNNTDHTIVWAYNQGNSFASIDYYLFVNTSNGRKFSLDVYEADGNECAYMEATTQDADGQYYFVVLTIDSDNQRVELFVDGVNEVSDYFYTPTIPLANRQQAFALGCEVSHLTPNTSEYQMNGAVDEVGVWHRTLTADEKTYLYNGGAGRSLY